MPSTEMRGSDATRPPRPGWRFAITDTAATMRPDISALTAKYSMPPPIRSGPARAKAEMQKKGRSEERPSSSSSGVGLEVDLDAAVEVAADIIPGRAAGGAGRSEGV